MSYVVKGRKADKYKMIRSVRAEIDLIQKDINELEEMKSNLWKFRNALAGKNGVEEAGKLYAEQEDTGACYGTNLPYLVARIYNPRL